MAKIKVAIEVEYEFDARDYSHVWDGHIKTARQAVEFERENLIDLRGAKTFFDWLDAYGDASIKVAVATE